MSQERNDPHENAPQLATETIRQLTSQLLSLSTALVVAGVAFVRLLGPAEYLPKYFAIVLSLIGITIVAGMLVFASMIHVFDSGDINVAAARNVRLYSAIQMFCFSAGLVIALLMIHEMAIRSIETKRSAASMQLTTESARNI